MQIKKINIENIENYKYLVEEKGTIYNSKEWLNIFDENLMIFGIFENDNKLIGAFNIYKQKIFKLNYLRNPFYSPSINIFFETKTKNKSKQLSENKKIITEITNFIDKLPYQILSIYFPPEIIDLQPFIWKKYKITTNYTFIIDLKQSLNEIENNFSPERKNDIKKALKDNVICKIIDDYEIVKNLILKTFSRKQKKIDKNFIDKILFKFANEQNSFACVSFLNETPIAAAFCIYDKFKTYYLLGGYDNNNKHQGAGALAVWEAIKHSKNLNIDKFDFEGSMIQEVEKYFRGFGGELTPYYSVNKANFFIEILLKIVKRETF